MTATADNSPPPAPAPVRVSCAVIFWAFVRVAMLTLGGGFAMAAVMRHELVHKRRWLGDDEFFTVLSTATAIPGPVAVNLAFLEGRRLGGRRGAAAAVVGMVLPSVVVILLVVRFALPWFDNPRVGAFFKGCAVAVAGQIAFASLTFAKRLRRQWRKVLICAVALAVVAAGLHPVLAIVIAAVLGYLICRPPAPQPAQPIPQDAQAEEME